VYQSTSKILIYDNSMFTYAALPCRTNAYIDFVKSLGNIFLSKLLKFEFYDCDEKTSGHDAAVLHF
jgi:hypothetical protein